MPSRRSALVCFVGMDGTGKTTQARSLARELSRRGLAVTYVQNRYRPLLAAPFFAVGRALFLRGRDARRDYAGYAASKRGALSRPVVSALFRRLVILDYLLQTAWRVGIPRALGRWVVCDRYLQDTAIDLATDLGGDAAGAAPQADAMGRRAPRPDLTFLLDLDEETAFARKDDTPSVEYLRERRRAYLELGRGCGAIVLDAGKPPDALEREIGAAVGPLVSQRGEGRA